MTVTEVTTCDLDNILNQLGGWKKFQVVNLILLTAVGMFYAFSSFGYMFTSKNLNYRCFVPGCDKDKSSSYDQPWLANAIPRIWSGNQIEKYESCRMYLPMNESQEVCSGNFADDLTTCDKWVYQTDEKTILTEDWGLHCDENRWKLSLVGSVNNLGEASGLLLLGYLSDRYGRKSILISSAVISGVMGIAKSFSNSYYMMIAFEFLDPFVGGAGVYYCACVLALESVSPSHRPFVNSMMSYSFTLASMILAGLAWWLRDWRTLLQVCYAPALLVLLYIWLIPESVRWLLNKGRSAEAMEILSGIAKKNKVELTPEILSALEAKNNQKAKESTKRVSLWTSVVALTKSHKMLMRFLLCGFGWSVANFVYDGMLLKVVDLPGNPYLNFIVSTAIQLPAHAVAGLILKKVNRRSLQSWMLFMCGVFCTVFIFIPPGDIGDGIKLTLFLGGRVAIAVSVNVMRMYTTELFPTVVRQTAMSVCVVFSKATTALVPETILLSIYFEHIPFAIFGLLCFLAGFATLFLPETLNLPLPDTIEEAENLSKLSKTTFSIPCCRSQKVYEVRY